MKGLPDDVLRRIFSFLDTRTLRLGAGTVCKHWWQLHAHPSLWRALTIPAHFTPERLRLMMRDVGDRVEILDISYWRSSHSDPLRALEEKHGVIPNVKTLIHTEYNMSDHKRSAVLSYFKHVSRVFPNLEALHNIYASYSPRNPMDNIADILEIQFYFPFLREVWDDPISCYSEIKGANQKAYANKERWLKNVKLLPEKCKNIISYKSGSFGSYLDDQNVVEIGRISKSFQTLCLSDVTNVSLQSLDNFLNSHSLEELELGDYKFAADRFNVVAKSVPNLKTLALNVSMTSDISLVDVIWKKLATLSCVAKERIPSDFTSNLFSQIIKFHSKHLRCLVLEGIHIYANDLVNICDKTPVLTSLTISNCPDMNDEALLMLSGIPNLKALRFLALPITPKGVLDFVRRMPSLLELQMDLSCQLKESDWQFSDIQSETCSELRRVSIFGYANRPSFVLAIAALCPNLMQLKHYLDISPKTLSSIIEKVPHLQEVVIKIPDDSQPDSDFLLDLAAKCPNLVKIVIRATMKNIDLKGIEIILQNCPHLSCIDICGNRSNINQSFEELVDTIQRVRKRCSVCTYGNGANHSFHFLEMEYLGQIG